MTTVAPPRPIRVAAYCRKSHVQGLDQEFNSIDAQRQSIESFIASQRGSGWIALTERYDDGGFSGSNTDRPAFQRLLADVQAGKVDCIAVYRIDRLSRNFADYIGILKLLDQHGVTFVSVTEQFNTTSPIGRLVLHQLILFSQFEREVISERVRDKVRATRRRGAWTGGKPVLGYAVVDKRLVVNPDEAIQVRATFALYLERGSLREAVAELKRRGWRNKSTVTVAGKTAGGGPFTNPTLHAMLTNTIYTGQMRCGSELVPGAHEAIVDADVWAAVQERLRSNGRSGGAATRNKTSAILRGLVRCGRCGSGMVHMHTSRKRNRRYGYYVCQKLHTEGPTACPGSRVPAGTFEAFVAEQIRAIGTDKALLAKTAESVVSAAAERAEQLDGELRRGEQERRRLETQLRAAQTPAAAATVDEQLQALARRQDEVRAEREALAGKAMHADLRDALAGFKPIWAHLFPRERERVLRLLIEQISYDPDTEQADINLRACGITTLAQEARSTK